VQQRKARGIPEDMLASARRRAAVAVAAHARPRPHFPPAVHRHVFHISDDPISGEAEFAGAGMVRHDVRSAERRLRHERYARRCAVL